MNNNFVVTIPRDLNQIKSKLVWGLTKRQLIGVIAAVLAGLPAFFYLKKYVSIDAGMYGLCIIAFPIIFVAIYKKNGMPTEVWLKNILESKFLYASKKIYKVNNKNAEIAKKRGMIRAKKAEPVSSAAGTR